MDERSETLRRALTVALRAGPFSAHELSERVGLPEREVASHLEHLEKSLVRSGETLLVVPARCIGCGFAFKARKKLTRPSRCPACKSERLSAPSFCVVAKTSR